MDKFSNSSGSSCQTLWFVNQLTAGLWDVYNDLSPKQIMFKSINPYNFLQNNPTLIGVSAHDIDEGEYVEYLGDFVRVDNSIISDYLVQNQAINSFHPSADLDNSGNLHISWLNNQQNSQYYSTTALIYSKLDITTNRLDGVP